MLRFLRALRHRDFRLFFVGQGVSLVGTWLQRVAFAWLVYRLTGSALVLGLVSSIGQLPTLVLSPWAGVFLDRRDRRRMLLLTQSAAMAQAFSLAGLVLWGVPTATQLAGLALALGVIDAFDAPARQSLLPAMVGGGDLVNAIALSSLLVNGARVVGPIIAGFVVVAAGEGACFFANGLSFGGVIAALLLMRSGSPRSPASTSMATDMRDGLRYAWTARPIRQVLGLLALVSLLGISYVVLLPLLAREVLGGDAQTLGFLTTASGAGAAAGAVFLAGLGRGPVLTRVAGGAATLFGLALAALAQVTSLLPAVAALVAVGFGLMVCTGSTNATLQTLVADGKRGRVMALYSMVFVGMVPLGAPLAGALATTLGPANTLMLSGAGCVAGALVFQLRAAPIAEAGRLTWC